MEKEKLLLSLIHSLDEIVFIGSTDSETGVYKRLKPSIEDREGTIYIKGEFDREDFKNVLESIFKQQKADLIKEGQKMKRKGYDMDEMRCDIDGGDPEDCDCDGYNQAIDDFIQLLSK